MANPHGEYIWYELLTDNLAGAKAFYGALHGWQFIDSGQNGYHLLQATDPDTGEQHHIGGAMALTAEMQTGGAQPGWLGYIGVDDVDACLERLKQAGAQTLMPAWNIPEVGRLALLADPQGVPFYIMRGSSNEASHAFAFDRPRIGHCAWNELVTSSPEAAWAFYGKEFNWNIDGEIDMGPLGAYLFIRHNGVIGAIMPQPDDVPRPQWNYYFRVADIDAAVNTVTAQSGQLLTGPDEIPGGEFSAAGLDPQGAVFAIVGPQK